MTGSLAKLQAEMDEAAERLDFEAARVLRDRIALLRAGATPDAAAAADTSGLLRQQPGNMGIGSSVARPERPPGWSAPAKPDPGTANRGRRRGK